MYTRLKRSIRNNKKESFIPTPIPSEKEPKAALPIIITDQWGMRFSYYPTDAESLEVVIGKEFYKPELLAIRKLVKKGDTTIDIGANIGLFSVFLSKEVGSKGKMYAFEPVQETYWRMRENLTLNRCTNAFAYQQAVSNKNGKATMNIFPEGYGAWNTFGKPTFGKIVPVATESVKITTLDSFVRDNKIGKVDFLKIDVEGYEHDVLEGAKELLSRGKVKYLSFEISDIPLKGAGKTGAQIFDKLREYGYTAYEFNPESNKFTGPVETSESFYQNFYASRSDMKRL